MNSYVKEEWNCGLLSVQDSLSRLGIRVTYDKLFSLFTDLGFRVYHFGISSIHIALLLKIFGFGVSLRTHSDWLKRLWVYQRKHKTSESDMPDEIEGTLRAMEMFILQGGNIYFSAKAKRPNIRSILSALKNGAIVISCVSAKDYYGINENWNHYLVLSPHMGSGAPFEIKDSLEKTGEIQYPDWKDHLKIANEYNWSAWSGDMILLSPGTRDSHDWRSFKRFDTTTPQAI